MAKAEKLTPATEMKGGAEEQKTEHGKPHDEENLHEEGQDAAQDEGNNEKDEQCNHCDDDSCRCSVIDTILSEDEDTVIAIGQDDEGHVVYKRRGDVLERVHLHRVGSAYSYQYYPVRHRDYTVQMDDMPNSICGTESCLRGFVYSINKN